ISLWTVVAAVQAVERSVGAQASRLLSLERRTGSTEKKYLDCERMVVEFGKRLESKLAVLGTLLREYGQLQRRLENVENLLKNRNQWALRLPPGSDVPKVTTESDAASSSAPEWDNLEEWQRELCKNPLRGKNEPSVSLDPTAPSPSLSRPQRGESPCSGDKVTSREVPAEPTDCSFPELSFAAVVKEEAELCVEERGATEDAEFIELSV
ncbi:ZN783 protein, partial [Heliornis fulica]|nr:ZN783 protein [Heliornis fulica]